MAQGSTETEPHVDFVSHVNWSELLIGPCHVALSLSSDGRVKQLSLRSLTVDLTFKDVSLISPGLLAKLLDTASQVPSSTGEYVNIDTGEIRELGIGEKPTEREVLLTAEEAIKLKTIDDLQERLEEYNKGVNTRQVRRAQQRNGK